MQDPRLVVQYSIRLKLAGVNEPFHYRVSKSLQERIREEFLGQSPQVNGPALDFFVFDDLESRTIAVSVSDVEYVNLLFDPASDDGLSEVEENDQLCIYFRGSNEPYITDDNDPEDVYDINFEIDTAGTLCAPFVSITNEDGEDFIFNLRHVVLMELPTAKVTEGFVNEMRELRGGEGNRYESSN